MPDFLGHFSLKKKTFRSLNVAGENSRHFETPPFVFPQNDVCATSAEITYWWRSLPKSGKWMPSVWNFCSRTQTQFVGKPVVSSWNVVCFTGCLICNLFLLHFQTENSTVDNTGNLRFKNIRSSFAATFFMMLDNLQYDNILLNYSGSVGNGLVLYILYFAYCFMMPIIFLNLLVSRSCCIKLT